MPHFRPHLVAIFVFFTFPNATNSKNRREMIRHIVNMHSDYNNVSLRFIINSNMSVDMSECEAVRLQTVNHKTVQDHKLNKFFIQNAFFMSSLKYKPTFVGRIDDDTFFDLRHIMNHLAMMPTTLSIYGKFRHYYSWNTHTMIGVCYAYNTKRWMNAQSNKSYDLQCKKTNNASEPFLFADGPLNAYTLDVAHKIATKGKIEEDRYLWYISNHKIGRQEAQEDVYYGYLVDKLFRHTNVRLFAATYTHPIKNGNTSLYREFPSFRNSTKCHDLRYNWTMCKPT